MSKGKRHRLPGGHPAKAAARHERDAARRSGRAPGSEDVARQILREAQGLTSALDAELWASELLGMLWSQRYSLPLAEAASPNYTLRLGEPLIAAVARLGGDGARTALSVISIVQDGELARRADELAESLNGGGRSAAPIWLSDVGEARDHRCRGDARGRL